MADSVQHPDSAYRILVTSSRTWTDRAMLYSTLDAAERRAHSLGYTVVVVVHGGAKGGDRMAKEWTLLRSPLAGMTRRPEGHRLGNDDWYPGGKFDASAGVRRNGRMVALGASECIAAVDECARTTCRRPKPHDSHGTADCRDRARAAGIPVTEVRTEQ